MNIKPISLYFIAMIINSNYFHLYMKKKYGPLRLLSQIEIFFVYQDIEFEQNTECLTREQLY